MRFIIDCMHGTLARKLRIYGFDTIYDSGADDKELLEAARVEDRVLVTSDRSLHRSALKIGAKSILLTEKTDEERMGTLFNALRIIKSMNPEASRCPVCNGTLESIARQSVEGKIPEGVLQRNDEFYICHSCGKVYWKGKHWLGIGAFADRVERRLHD